PALLAKLQVRDFHAIDKIIDEYIDRQKHSTHSYQPRIEIKPKHPRYLIFDIDGTVLNISENLEIGKGREFGRLLSELGHKGYKFVFITGNDFNKQESRVLLPIRNMGFSSNVFCFTDGGSRAFEFNEASKVFHEVHAYSDQNIMSDDQVKMIKEVINNAIQ